MEDFQGINLDGSKKYEGVRPNHEALEQKIIEEIQEAYQNITKLSLIDKIAENELERENEQANLRNAVTSYLEESSLENAQNFLSQVRLFASRTKEKLREDYAKLGEFDEKEFDLLFSGEMFLKAISRMQGFSPEERDVYFVAAKILNEQPEAAKDFWY